MDLHNLEWELKKKENIEERKMAKPCRLPRYDVNNCKDHGTGREIARIRRHADRKQSIEQVDEDFLKPNGIT